MTEAGDIIGALVAYIVVVAVFCEVTGYRPSSLALLVGMVLTVAIRYGLKHRRRKSRSRD